MDRPSVYPARAGLHRAAPALHLAPWLLAAPWLLVLLSLLAGGCAKQGAIAGGAGGLPATQAARISLVVAQTRSQFPDLSAAAVPYETRLVGPDATDAEPEPALIGTGVSVKPGLQLGEREHIAVTLQLDKTSYAAGFLEVTPAGGAAQRWPIVAFDRRGQPRGTFDFTYVLATPEQQLRYLVVLGGRYSEGDAAYLGYEGTLIEPGPGNNLEQWPRAFKLDFGFRFPVVPPHQPQVEQAAALFREIERHVDALERLRARTAAAEGEQTTLRSTEAPAERAAAQQAAIAKVETALADLRTQRQAAVEAAEAKLVRYYELRTSIAHAYAAFTETNRYRWLDTQGRQAFYDAWKVVEFHHPRIDELVSTFLTHKEDAGRVLDARTAAMAVITRLDNWSRDPSRKAEARRR